MKKLILTCVAILSLGVFVGCNDDDKDEPGSGSSNVTSGNVSMGDDDFNAKYAFVVYGSEFDSYYDEYYFANKDLLKYVESGKDMDDVDEEFSIVYIEYNTRSSKVSDMEIEYKLNEYRGTGFYIEYEGNKEISDYVTLSASKSLVKAVAKSIPMVRYNVRTGNESDAVVSFSLEANPTDISDYVDYDDDYYSETRSSSVEIIKVSDPKQIAYLRSLTSKKNR